MIFYYNRKILTKKMSYWLMKSQPNNLTEFPIDCNSMNDIDGALYRSGGVSDPELK